MMMEWRADLQVSEVLGLKVADLSLNVGSTLACYREESSR